MALVMLGRRSLVLSSPYTCQYLISPRIGHWILKFLVANKSAAVGREVKRLREGERNVLPYGLRRRIKSRCC